MHHLAAGTCQGGPCPDLTRDLTRHKIGGQGYIPPVDALADDLPPTPEGEVRWETDPEVFYGLLARFLTDDEVAHILDLRAREAAAA